MNILLDTHTFLWWITDDSRLSDVARNVIADSGNNLFWSSASSWEVAIKNKLGRLPLPEEPRKFISEELQKNRIEPLPIIDEHAFHAAELPSHHKDPFDRMLIAQAQTESFTLLSCDSCFALYDVDVRW